MFTLVSAYRGKKLVYRSQFSYTARLADLVASWEATGCRVTVLRFKSPRPSDNEA